MPEPIDREALQAKLIKDGMICGKCLAMMQDHPAGDDNMPVCPTPTSRVTLNDGSTMKVPRLVAISIADRGELDRMNELISDIAGKLDVEWSTLQSIRGAGPGDGGIFDGMMDRNRAIKDVANDAHREWLRISTAAIVAATGSKFERDLMAANTVEALDVLARRVRIILDLQLGNAITQGEARRLLGIAL